MGRREAHRNALITKTTRRPGARPWRHVCRPGQLNANKAGSLDRQSKGHRNPNQQQACRHTTPAQGREVITMVLMSGPMHTTRCAEYCQRNNYWGRDTRRPRKMDGEHDPGHRPCNRIDERKQAPARPVGSVREWCASKDKPHDLIRPSGGCMVHTAAAASRSAVRSGRRRPKRHGQPAPALQPRQRGADEQVLLHALNTVASDSGP